jgi:16S rRNA (adenine1518-N6/adenine1519-N6)-dimethyltransferase
MATLYEEVRAALRESNFKPRKSRGQNFLIHERVIDSIIRLLDLSAADEIIEIGPGLGFLTRRLLEHAGQVWAVEIDPLLVERLRGSAFGADPKLHLIQGDILQVSLAEIFAGKKIKLAGNLPYNIATQVLFRIFEWREHFSSLVLMVQKEVADRIVSGPGTKDYGALSILCQVHGRITGKVSVSPEAFFPRPKVRSTVLKVDLFPEARLEIDQWPVLRNLVRAAFDQRRKTLGNALAAFSKHTRDTVEDFLRSQEIDPRRRGETLSVDEFIRLAHAAHGQVFFSGDNEVLNAEH